jgi:hypothetical protein
MISTTKRVLYSTKKVLLNYKKGTFKAVDNYKKGTPQLQKRYHKKACG